MKSKVIYYLDKAFIFNVVVFPYIVSQSAVLYLIETFTYKNFVSNYLFLPVEFWFLISLTSGFMVLLTVLSTSSLNKNTLDLYKLAKTVIPIILANMVLVYLLFVLAFSNKGGTINYGGKFLIYPDRIVFAILLMIYFAIISNLIFRINTIKKYSYNITSRLNNISSPEILYTFISLAIIAMLFKSSIFSNVTLFSYNMKNIIKNPLASYDDKMSSQIGPIYNYYQFVNENTPASAVILHPTQQGQWPDISNAGYTRYFIYPRNLIAEEEMDARHDEITHVFVIGGRKLHNNKVHNRWPNFNIPAEKVIYYKQGTNDVLVVEGDYNPEDLQENEDFWGIIEVKKNTIW